VEPRALRIGGPARGYRFRVAGCQTDAAMSQPTDPRLGTTIGGYRIESLIGRGGMSVVYLAEDVHLGRRVALKFLAPELASDSKFRERFVRESRLAASLEHPNIVTVYEAREADGQLYLAMRYVAGTDLKRLIASEGPFDPERTVSILTQTASALDAAHAEGLIHRDVKPGNILITPRSGPGGRDRVYLSDFGLTKRATSDSGITATGQFVGTLDYAAPEQFEGGQMDGRADVYSLGGVLYECLTGDVPYPRENQAALVYAHLQAPPPKVTAIRAELPPTIDGVVAKAMSKLPDDRYQSAGELAEAAAQALGVEAVAPVTPTRPVGTPPSPRPPRRTSRSALVGMGAGAVAVALVVGLIVANRGGKTPAARGTSEATSTGPAAVVVVDYVARIDRASGQILARIPMGEHPIDVAVGEGSVWVVDKDGSVRRIDPVTNTAVVIDGVAEDPRAIAAGEGAVWVADGIKGVLRKIDPASNRVEAPIQVGGVVFEVAAGGGAAWAATNQAEVRVDPGPEGRVAASFTGSSGADSSSYVSAVGGGFLWVANDAGGLYRYEISTGKLDRFQLQVPARALAATQSDVWVTGCGTPGTVIRIDARTGEVLATIAAGGAVCPYVNAGNQISVAAGPEGVWVTDGFNGTVSRIRETTNQVDAPIKIGDNPIAIAEGLTSVWVVLDGQEVSPSPSTS
jgi:tRNA A-37 threonylcarbamoyl transferase component Bud32